MIQGISGTALAALGVAILAYRAYLTLSGEFGLSVHDVALLSSVRVATRGSSLADVYEIAQVFDFSRAHSLLRQMIDAQLGMLLVIIGAMFSLAGLITPRGADAPGTIGIAFAAGIVSAWAITKGYRALWWRLREQWWLAHGWLAWLERQTDPLAQSSNASQDVIYVVMASQHHDLERFLHERFRGQPVTGEVRDAIERWIADFAARWKYGFHSKQWREWTSNLRSGSGQRRRG